MSAIDIEQAAQVLRDYATAIIDEHLNGGRVDDLEFLIRLEKAAQSDTVVVNAVGHNFEAVLDYSAHAARLVALATAGRCGIPAPAAEENISTLTCQLRAGHPGQHEARWYPQGILSVGEPVFWSTNNVLSLGVAEARLALRWYDAIPNGTFDPNGGLLASKLEDFIASVDGGTA